MKTSDGGLVVFEIEKSQYKQYIKWKYHEIVKVTSIDMVDMIEDTSRGNN